MKDEDIKWLREEFPQFFNKTIRGAVYNAYLKAEMILLNRDSVNKRDCSCHYRGLAESVNKLYSNWLHNNGKE